MIARAVVLYTAHHAKADRLARLDERRIELEAEYRAALIAALEAAARRAPGSLDWLTLFTVLMFAASFIAAGRRKLLTR